MRYIYTHTHAHAYNGMHRSRAYEAHEVEGGVSERELYWNIIIRIMYLWHHFLIYMKRLSFVIRPFHIRFSHVHSLFVVMVRAGV